MRPRVTCAIHTRCLCGHVRQPGKSWFMRALCTPDAYGTSPCCRAVRPICLEMGLHTSSLQMTLPLPLPQLTAPAHTHTHTHTHRLAKLEATNMQLQQRASRWCGSPSVGHVGRYLAWAAMVVRAHYASICWTSAPSVGVSDWGMLPHNNM